MSNNSSGNSRSNGKSNSNSSSSSNSSSNSDRSSGRFMLFCGDKMAQRATKMKIGWLQKSHQDANEINALRLMSDSSLSRSCSRSPSRVDARSC